MDLKFAYNFVLTNHLIAGIVVVFDVDVRLICYENHETITKF